MIFREARDALLAQLAMPLNLTDLEEGQAILTEQFKEKRPKRERQLSRLRHALNP